MCKQSKTGRWEGLGMRLSKPNVSLCPFLCTIVSLCKNYKIYKIRTSQDKNNKNDNGTLYSVCTDQSLRHQ